MPLNSVQNYVKGQLDGITIPGQNQPLQAWITPPVYEDIEGPRCYVWGGRCDATRQTMPRGAGFKKLPWLIDIYLVYETNPADANFGNNTSVDSEFPLIVDAVLETLWNQAKTPMPFMITDPTTGQQSQIQAIGERWSLDYPPERTPNTMRMLWYSCMITMDVLEIFQG